MLLFHRTGAKSKTIKIPTGLWSCLKRIAKLEQPKMPVAIYAATMARRELFRWVGRYVSKSRDQELQRLYGVAVKKQHDLEAQD